MIDAVDPYKGTDPADDAEARYAEAEQAYLQRAQEAACCDCRRWHVCPSDEGIGWCTYEDEFEDADMPVWQDGEPCAGWEV